MCNASLIFVVLSFVSLIFVTLLSFVSLSVLCLVSMCLCSVGPTLRLCIFIKRSVKSSKQVQTTGSACATVTADALVNSKSSTADHEPTPCAVCEQNIMDGKDQALYCEGVCKQWFHRLLRRHPVFMVRKIQYHDFSVPVLLLLSPEPRRLHNQVNRVRVLLKVRD